MQQFVVPQFIDVEDKVLGPLSVRQFIILLVGAGLLFLLFNLVGLIEFVFAAILVMLLLFVFAFIKINGRPFHYFLLSLLQTFRRPSLKLWMKDVERYQFKGEIVSKKKGSQYVPKQKLPLSTSRLTQVSLVVDTGGAYDRPESEQEESVIDPGITTLEI
ncbi:MAG: PrgI family protein [Patescibacteria group bacterium]|jgi:hypothetical protein